MSGQNMISRVLMLGCALYGGMVFHPHKALGQGTAANSTVLLVFPPRDVFVGTTESGGARASGESRLAAFLAGAKAKDQFDPHPIALPPQVNGVDVDANTFFPIGATVVTFRFTDATGIVSANTAKVTVVDIQQGDLFVGAASIYDGYGNTVGGIYQVRGGTVTLYCQPESADSSDPRFWNIPQDVMVDPQARVVFVAYLQNNFASGGALGLYRCDGPGAPPELLAVFPNAYAPLPTQPAPFGGMRFGNESGMHLEEKRSVAINDLHSVPTLSTDDVYALVLLVGGQNSATGSLKSVRYHPSSGTWDDGPDLGRLIGSCANGFQCEMPDLAFHSGATYVVSGGILHRDKIPLQLDASGTVGGTAFTVSVGLFGSDGDIANTILRDSSYPTIPSGCPPPSNGLRSDMPFIGTSFRGEAGFTDVVYDEYTGHGLVIGSNSVAATAPYLANVSEALLEKPDNSLYFQDSYLGCQAVAALDVSSPLPFYGVHGTNGSRSLVSTPQGVFGVNVGTIVQMAPGVDATDQRVVATGLPYANATGLGGWPPKLSAGIGFDIIIRVDSPVNVLVTDANGKSIGVDAAGNAVNDFGRDGFDSGPGEPRFFAINNPAPGAYAVQAVGTGNGPYTVHVYAADFSFPDATQAAISGVTTIGQTDSLPFTLDSNSNVAFVSKNPPPGNPITVIPSVTAANKTYDGTVAATIISCSLNGVLAADAGNVGCTTGSAAFADANAGNSKIVTATGLGLSGTAAGNYVLSATAANTTANITQALATPSITAVSKTYDGTVAAATGCALTGVLAADTGNLSCIAGNAAFADANAGSGKAVTATGLTLNGAAAVNYLLSTSTAITTANIYQAALTVTASNAARAYGQANPPISANYTGFINGQGPGVLSGALNCGSPATPASSVAGSPYATNCTGVSSPNYAVSYVPGTLAIVPAPLTIAANSAKRPYGANNPQGGGTITGLLNGDPISASFTPAATPASPVGTYAIAAAVIGGPNVLSNYAIALVNGTLTVVPEPTSLTITFAPVTIMVGQSTTATVMLVAPDMVIPIDPSVLTPVTVTSPVVSDMLSNNGACTPVVNTAPGIATCTVTVTAMEPNGRTLNGSFSGSADLVASSGVADLIVTAALQSQQACIASDFRNVAVAGGNSLWFNSIFKVRDVSSKQKINISFYKSSVQFQYKDISGNVVTVNQAMPDARILIDPSATAASTGFDAVNNVWITTIPWDLDDNSFLTGMPWQVPVGGIPADVEPVNWCGTFASDTPGIDIGWRWGAAAYSSFSGDNNVLGVKPMDMDNDNPPKNHDRAGTPENFKSFVIPGARGKGGTNYTGTYSRSKEIE